MKDKFSDLFHDRFTGHEVEVPPGAWEAISTQVATGQAAGMQGGLQDKFTGHEMPVDPGVWQHISSQLGHGAVAGTGAGIGTSWIAAGVAALVVTGGLVYWTLKPEAAPAPADRTEVAHVQPTEKLSGSSEAKRTAPIVADAVPAATGTSANPEAVPEHRQTPVRTAAPTTPVNTMPTRQQPTSVEPPPPTPQGEKVVSDVMHQLVADNATNPAPQTPETVPPPSVADLPPQPLASPEEAPATEQPTTHATSAMDEPSVFIPNVFSPNGDNVNDKLRVTCEHCEAVEVRIFSAKNGQLVYKAKDLNPEHAWDGRQLDGREAEDGYYFYAIEVTGEDGHVRSKGEVVRLFHP